MFFLSDKIIQQSKTEQKESNTNNENNKSSKQSNDNQINWKIFSPNNHPLNQLNRKSWVFLVSFCNNTRATLFYTDKYCDSSSDLFALSFFHDK